VCCNVPCAVRYDGSNQTEEDDRKEGASKSNALSGGKYDSKLPVHKHTHCHSGSGSNSCGEDGGVLAYSHEFLLTDASAVLPVYLIRAEVDTSAVNKREPKCESCEKNDATVYCEQDDAVLCHACDQEVHSANRLVSRHNRVPVRACSLGRSLHCVLYCSHIIPITPPHLIACCFAQMQERLLKENGHCSEHPQKKVEFYCNTCATPVCVWCKMIGNHSSGEAVHHKLTEIFMAYNQARNESAQPDPVLRCAVCCAVLRCAASCCCVWLCCVVC
jgi:hypothetical protein